MLGIENLASFLLASLLVIVVPGPATIYVAGEAQRSARGAALACAGIVAGDVVLIAASGLGLSALVASVPALVTALKIVGALYIAYLGAAMLKAGPDGEAGGGAAPGGFVKGLLITLTNPKPILFFGAFFPLFIGKAAGSWAQSFYALGGLFEAINLAYFGALVLLVAGLRRAAPFGRPSAGRLRKASGCGLLLCAAFLLAAALVPSK